MWQCVKASCVVGGFIVATASGAGAGPRVEVDGKMVRGPRTYMIGGHLMVPVRGVLQRIPGTRVQYSPKRQVVWVTRGSQRVRLQLQSGYAQVNGQGVPLDAPVVMRDRRALMPVRFVSEVLGAEVRFDEPRQVVSIRSGSPNVLSYRSTDDGKNSVPGRVAIGGVEIITLPTPAGYASLDARATATTERLNDALADVAKRGGYRAARVWVSDTNTDPVIYVGRKPVLRVMADDVKSPSTTQQQLAEEWLGRVRAGLTRVYGQR